MNVLNIRDFQVKTPGEGRYESIVTVDEKRFTSKVSQANKKMAQQASALTL